MNKHVGPAAGTRGGVVATATIGVPVLVFSAGYGMARDAELTGWLLLVLLVGSGGYGIVRWLLRAGAGQR